MARDTLDVFGVRYTDVVGIKATDSSSTVQRYVRPEGTLSITVNNVYDVASYASVSVNVQGGTTINNQHKTVDPSTSQQVVTYDSGYTGLEDVTVNAVPQAIISSEGEAEYKGRDGIFYYTFPIISSGYISHNITGYINPYSISGMSVITGQTITPTESSQIAASAETFIYDGDIVVAGISSNYVGTGVARKSSADLIVSGQSVNGPAGYYSEAFSKSVALMTLPTTFPTTSTGTNKATIDRSTATRYLNIPVGYNSASAFYTISSVPNGIAYPPATINGASATVTAGTNVLTFSKAISLTPDIATAGYISQGTASNVTVTLSAAISTKAAATITPGTANQTISSKYYLTGTQTIAGDADLIAANIKTGVNIFNVAGTFTADANASAADIKSGQTAYVNGSKITGTLVTQNYYSGSTTPTAGLGNNGDIYLKVS